VGGRDEENRLHTKGRKNEEEENRKLKEGDPLHNLVECGKTENVAGGRIG